MRRILFTLILLSSPSIVSATTRTTTDCSAAAIQAQVNASADGDTVLVPPGLTATWQAVTITITKGITLNGQGCVVTWPATHDGFLQITTDAVANVEVTGFTFNGAYQPFGSCGAPIELMSAPGTLAYRFFGNTLNMTPGGVGGGAGRVVGTIGDGPGLIDHNTFNAAGVAADEWIQNCGSGNESTWTRDIVPGSLSMVFIEDNAFVNGASNGCCVSGYRGTQFVARHNCMVFGNFDGHSDTPPNVGTRWEEIYQNNYVITNVPNGGPGGFTMATMANLRGGSGVFWGNHAVQSCSIGTSSGTVTACDNQNSCTGHNLGPIPGSSDPVTGPYPIPHQAGFGIESPTGTFHFSPQYSWGNDAILGGLVTNDSNYVQIGSTPTSSSCTAVASTGKPANQCEGVDRGPSGTGVNITRCQTQQDLTTGCPVTYTYVPAVYPHPLQSNNPQASTPVAIPAGGTFQRWQSVSLSSASSGAIICTTTNGTTPVINGASICPPGSTKYTTPISISQSGNTSATTTLIAVAGGPSLTDSSAASNTYTIQGDQYGGRLDILCATTTAYFHLEKINQRWFFCTPQGHGFISMNVANVVTNGPGNTPDCANVNTVPIYTAKYGDTTFNWSWQTNKRIVQWGFNTLGQDTGAQPLPGATCVGCIWPGGTQPIKLPYITESKPAENASINASNFISEPIKDLVEATDGHYTSFRGGATYDVFDPKLSQWWNAALATNTALKNNDPFLVGIFTDDSDFFWGSGASPDYITGHTPANVAWTTLISSPVQTYVNATSFGGGQKFIYNIQQNYSKTQALNPATCSIASPCSLRDYLKNKYTTIAALNTAWGSNYTTFDSTATQVTGEAFATGDGVTTSFTHTFAHPPDPFSVLLLVAGTSQLGDCPWYYVTSNGNCINTTANMGTLGSPTRNVATAENHTVPAGTPFTVTVTQGAFFLSNTSVKYHSSGTALTAVTGTPTTGQYNAGTSANGGVYTFSAGDASASLDFTYNFKFNNQATSTINYTTGAVTINFTVAPANGAAITANYQFGGWGQGGTGLMDENGSGSWVGTNPACLEGANPSYPTYFSCIGGGGNNNPVPNANANLGADLDNYVSQFAAQYFKTMQTDLRAVSHIPYLGLDLVGAWSAPAYSKFLQGNAPYVDALMTDMHWFLPLPSPTVFQNMYQYNTQYLGDIPIINYGNGGEAQSDSGYSCKPGDINTVASQPVRGQNYQNAVNYLLTTPSFNGDFPVVGFDHWSWQDFQNLNQGLVDVHDNAYDGIEAVVPAVSCASYYLSNTTCGGEPTGFNAPYGNYTTPVTAANQIWLSVTSGSGAPTAAFSPTSFAFPATIVNQTAGPNGITLQNTGTAPLLITGITIVGTNQADFSQTNTCPASLAVNATCTISASFTPSAVGARSANISVVDNAAGSPQSVPLSGTGTAPIATVSPGSLVFGGVVVNQSQNQNVTLQNTGNAALTITSIVQTGTGFTQTNNCPASLGAGLSCVIQVNFAPLVTGTSSGTLTITDNSFNGSPQTVGATGSGILVPSTSTGVIIQGSIQQ